MDRYDPVRKERSELARVVAAFVKELIDGRGPVCIDLRYCDDEYWNALAAVSVGRNSNILLSDRIPDPKTTPLPIEPAWGMWNNSCSGLKIDLSCRATLPALFAAGSCSKNEATGTHGTDSHRLCDEHRLHCRRYGRTRSERRRLCARAG